MFPQHPGTAKLPPQSLAVLHATHVPVPLQTVPPVLHAVPRGSALQTPCFPGTAHELQEPAVQALLQQTPSAQNVLAQSVLPAHPLPGPQVLPNASQVAPPQSTSVSVPSFTPSVQETQMPP